MVSVTGGVLSGRDPLLKTASHTTSVPLYSDLAGMVSMNTLAPFSLTELVVMLGNCSSDESFTLQPMIVLAD